MKKFLLLSLFNISILPQQQCSKSFFDNFCPFIYYLEQFDHLYLPSSVMITSTFCVFFPLISIHILYHAEQNIIAMTKNCFVDILSTVDISQTYYYHCEFHRATRPAVALIHPTTNSVCKKITFYFTIQNLQHGFQASFYFEQPKMKEM